MDGSMESNQTSFLVNVSNYTSSISSAKQTDDETEDSMDHPPRSLTVSPAPSEGSHSTRKGSNAALYQVKVENGMNQDSGKPTKTTKPRKNDLNAQKLPPTGMDEIALLKRGYIDKDSAKHPYTRYHHDTDHKDQEDASKRNSIAQPANLSTRESQKKTRKKKLGLDEIELLQQGMISKDSAHHLYNRYQHTNGKGLSDSKATMGMDEIALLKNGIIDKDSARHPYTRYHEHDAEQSGYKTTPISLEELKNRGLYLENGQTVYSIFDIPIDSSTSDCSITSSNGTNISRSSSSSSSSQPGSSRTSETTDEEDIPVNEFKIGRPEENAELKVWDHQNGTRYQMTIDRETTILQTTPDNILALSFIKEDD